MSRTFRALRVRNYRRYAAGQLVANTGIWMQRVAQDWLVLELTNGSAALLGITVGLQFLPTLLLSMLGGTLADRFPRRRLLMVTSTTMGALAAVLGGIVIAGSATVAVVMVLALALGAVSAVDTPTRQAFVSEMVDVEDLPNAVGLSTASFNLGRVLGPSAAGLLIAAVGTGWVFLLNALAFSAVLVALLGVHTDELRVPVTPSRDNGGLRAGLRYVWVRPELVMVLVVAFFVGTFGLNFNLYLATMTSQVFHGDARSFGVASTILALGSLAGSLAAARRGAPRLRLVVLAALAFGGVSVAVALMPTYLSFVVLLPLVGASALTVINAMQSFLQVHSEPEIRGRVLGIYMLLFIGGTPLGSPLMGWIAETAGPRWAIAFGGVVSAVAAGVAGLLRLRRAGMRVRAHLSPRPHVHVVTQEAMTAVRAPRWSLRAVLHRAAVAAGLLAVVLSGIWWADSSARADSETQLPGSVAFRIKDPEISEASGMAAGRALPGVTWLVEDSGGEAVVYGVDNDGRTVARVTVEDATNDDWEALAPGTDAQGRPTLWIGDIGDNHAERSSVQLYEIPEPAQPGDQSAVATRYDLTYADGPRNAETLLVDSASATAYVVSKEILDPGMYSVPLAANHDGTLERVADAPLVVTDGAFDPQQKQAVLRTYTLAYLLPAITSAPSQSGLLPEQPQGETIAWTPDGAAVLSGSEGLRSVVHRVPLPDSWLAPQAGGGAAQEPDGGWRWPALAVAALVVGGAAFGVSRAAARRSRSTA